jgi:hypothetical protein
MRTTARSLLLAAALLPAASAMAGHDFPVPDGLATPATAAGPLTVWPYTASDFTDPAAPVAADPVNLVFLNTDPRAVRQALMGLSGDRTALGFPSQAPFDCRWSDAMGYEQAAYGEPAGWVGGAIQLACYSGGNALGNPFRYHVRLFRIGEHTLGAAHFEILIPNTAEHEVLSWTAARDFVVYDLRYRARVPLSVPSAVPLFAPVNRAFRAVRRPIYDALVGDPTRPNAAWGILAYAGLPTPPFTSQNPPPPAGDVGLPADGYALVLAAGLEHQPATYDVTTTLPAVQYDVNIPKPFCGVPGEYVNLSGALEFEMRVKTNPSGQYLRTYRLGGTLKVKALSGPDAGRTFDAVISERHRAMLTDEYDQVTEIASQLLLRRAPQALGWVFGVGHQDGYLKETVCGAQ